MTTHAPDTDTNPYSSFTDYWTAGWRGIIHIPHRAKWPPPAGYTGYEGNEPSYADCHTWAEDGPRNIALRLPPGIIGIDVDHYGDKHGGDTLAAMVEQYGALPPTWLSTSRDDGISGIRLYRVPDGTTLPTALPGIEFIQHFHRYVMAWPSIHPEGRRYQWVDENAGHTTRAVPSTAGIPDLPERWIRGLAVEGKDPARKADITTGESHALLAALPKGDPCAHVLKAAGRTMQHGQSRHDAYNEAVLAVLGAGRRGCPGSLAVISRLHHAFTAEILDRATPSEAEAEWQRSLRGAIAIVAAEPAGTGCPDDVLDWIDTLDTPTPHAESTGGTGGTGGTGEEAPDTPYDQEVRRRYGELRINEDAKTMLAAHKAGQAPPLDATALPDLLAQPDTDTPYRIDELWPAQGRTLLAAAAKSGKTTTVAANLIPSLADGTPFLGRYPTQQAAGNIVLLNMEVGENTIRRWMRDAHIDNAHKVIVANLRGKASALGLATPPGRRRLAEFLTRHQAEIVILDPLAPVLASLGLDENDNSDVAAFFAHWSEVMGAAGIHDDLIVHHTGHAGQRSRGASRLLDEPDAIWTLSKDDDKEHGDNPFGAPPATRYLAAYGRDVDLPRHALKYDPDTRRLIITDLSPKQSAAKEAEHDVIALMSDQRSRSANAICKTLGGTRQTYWDAIERLKADGTLQHGGLTPNKHPLWVMPEMPVSEPR